MTPRMTIVIPTLNEASHIVANLRALRTVRAQGVEVIVADGGSTDRTDMLARPWADAVLTCPRGRAKQMNLGAARARGATLLFLHADTLLPADAMQAIDSALADAQVQWGRFDVQIEGKARLLKVIAEAMNMRSRATGIATGDQALFVRREAFERIGGFPDQPLMEDIEISKRLRKLAKPACLRQRVVTSGRRWDRRGVWRTMVLM
ncbi:MAG TPA: TIGR04283 family arsenosugar biosynthesis glycosyltransferase, partial [Burkholderiaceae bacterium]|nr:TIGR04283 family arsenosugar biosynthesis glycosyltransferase [Burkholderiaceae bacterium]